MSREADLFYADLMGVPVRRRRRRAMPMAAEALAPPVFARPAPPVSRGRLRDADVSPEPLEPEPTPDDPATESTLVVESADWAEAIPGLGRGTFRHAPLGAGENVEARWNCDPATTNATSPTVAVVIHLHGYGAPTESFLANKARMAGVDLVNASGTVTRRRGQPTLALVPLGQFTERTTWVFDQIKTSTALNRLIEAGLAFLASQLGIPAGTKLARGRLTLMAHSGGGDGLSKMLDDKPNPINPDEVVCFDSMYGGEGPIIAWATAKITSPLVAVSGLRVFYTPCGSSSWTFRQGKWRLSATEVSARRTKQAIDKALAMLPAAAATAVASRYQVQLTKVGHSDIPATYAPLLLDDIGTTLLPQIGLLPAATVRPACVANDDWLTSTPLRPGGMAPPPPEALHEVLTDGEIAEDIYRVPTNRVYAPSTDPTLFQTAPVPVAVAPATQWPEVTTNPDAASSTALTAAGATAATVAAYAGAGLAALRPIAARFGAPAMTELLARLRYTPAQLAAPPHSHGDDAHLRQALHQKGPIVQVARQAVLAMRLLLAIPGHFRQLARRTDDEREAFALENLGWLLMRSLRADVAAAAGVDFWLPSAPPFVAGFPTTLPAIGDQARRLVMRAGFLDDTQDLPAFLGRFNAWRTGAAGRMWRLETGREAAPGRLPGAPFYPQPFTIPATINTATQRAQVQTKWTERLAAFDAGTNRTALTDCAPQLLEPLHLMSNVSARGLELVMGFPTRSTTPLTKSFTGLALIQPAFEAAFQALSDLGWNDLVFETQGMGCFRGQKVPGNAAAARRMSEHSLGVAIDLNVFENGQNTDGAMDPRVVALFEAFRFRWGKGFQTPDPMHFEYAG
jgi:hypothetical protein